MLNNFLEQFFRKALTIFRVGFKNELFMKRRCSRYSQIPVIVSAAIRTIDMKMPLSALPRAENLSYLVAATIAPKSAIFFLAWVNLIKKTIIVSLCWNLISPLIQIWKIQWWCSLFPFLTGHTFFGDVSLSWNLRLKLI